MTTDTMAMSRNKAETTEGIASSSNVAATFASQATVVLDEAAAETSSARSERSTMLVVADSVKEEGGVRRHRHQSVRRRFEARSSPPLDSLPDRLPKLFFRFDCCCHLQTGPVRFEARSSPLPLGYFDGVDCLSDRLPQ